MTILPSAATRRAFLLGLLAAMLAQAGAAEAADTPPSRPNFTGRWHIVPQASDLHARAPDDVVHTIEHKDTDLTIHTVHTLNGATTAADLHYYTDGRVTRRKTGEVETETAAHWDGAALVIRTDGHNTGGEKFYGEARWSLSDDRQTLIIATRLGGPRGDFALKQVCVRETT